MNDNERYILQIQRYLKIIFEGNEKAPQSPQDAIFGEETRAAVKYFQRNNSLASTGIVDKATFDLLVTQSSELQAERNAQNDVYARNDFPLILGSSGNDVSILNSTLKELSAYYDITEGAYGDFFSKETESAVRDIQKILREDINGLVSEALYQRLKQEVGYRKKF